jgi:hypothetical protein
MANIHVGNVGTSFRANARDQDGNIIPVGTGDDLRILFLKPDGSTVIQTAVVFYGPSGMFEYVSVSGDLDQSGSWKVQGYVSQSGARLYGDEIKFKVFPNITQVS